MGGSHAPRNRCNFPLLVCLANADRSNTIRSISTYRCQLDAVSWVKSSAIEPPRWLRQFGIFAENQHLSFLPGADI